MEIAHRTPPTGRSSAGFRSTRLASRWLRAVLLGVVVLLLAALLLVPAWISRRADTLRGHLAEVVFPAQAALFDYQLALSETLAAVRGYRITGDTAFLAGLHDPIARQRSASDQLSGLAPELGPESFRAIQELRARDGLIEPRALRSEAPAAGEPADSLAARPQRLEAAVAAAERARMALNGSANELRDRIRAAMRLERQVVELLSLAGLVVVLVVAWLMSRLQRLSTQLQLRAERLHESEERFRLIAENLREMIWISDPAFTVQYYLSPAYETIWGRSIVQARDNPRSFLESVLPQDRDGVESALERYPQGEYEAQYRILRPDGEVRWIAGRAYPVKNEHAEVVYVVGIAEDITAQKEAETVRERLLEREVQAHAETEAALRMRDRVLRIVSHDLKNPLHTIGMAAELLEMRLPEERRTHQLDIIRRTVARANRMVLDLLDAARIQSGQSLAIRPQRLPVRPMLEEAVETFRLQAGEKRQQLVCEVADGTSPVCVDYDRLVQALSNLIGNAVKFTPEGGLIRVCAEPDKDGAVRFSVADTGPGISAELLPLLFEPFAQAKDTASLGTGLGLAIARGIVEAHGGELQARSEPARGTTFAFTLPAAR